MRLLTIAKTFGGTIARCECGMVCVIVAVVACFSGVPASAAEPEPGLALFREKIEPLLRERCFECHSHDAGDASGGLMLDSKAGWQVGGDTGPSIVPGKPDESPLVRAVRYADPNLEMPPDGKLSEAEVAAITEWVRLGAPDPRGGDPIQKSGGIDLKAGREFWSYQPIADPALPKVADESWPTNEIDHFVLAKLEAAGLRPAEDADRATLARRLYFDLTGLPPTPEEIDAFVLDSDPRAYEKLVDDLLARRSFGERWGRHWLDIARFAESVTLRGLIFKEAWRYRDYVIDAFDRDLPFDELVREQIAGDLLSSSSREDRTRKLVATTYLMLGNTNLEEQDKTQLRMDFVDEQLDVITKGFLAQTVTCARCHDHKFDPIPTRDYYALAGILRSVKCLEDANVSGWVEVPLPAAPEIERAVAKYDAEVKNLAERIKVAKASLPKVRAARNRGPIAIADVPGIVVDDEQAMKVGEWKQSVFSGEYVGAGYIHDIAAGKGEKSLTFQPSLPADGVYEVWLAYSPGDSRSNAAPVTVFGPDGEKTLPIDMRQPGPIGGRFVSLGRHRFEKDGQTYVLVANEGTSGHVTADAVVFIPEAEASAAEGKFLQRGDDPKNAETAQELAALEAELKTLQKNAPPRPMAMSVKEEQAPADIPVHIRGSVHSLGEVVPRGFLQVASYGSAPQVPGNLSGRVELADWLASAENPLTARVFANRAWHWLFGAGIVRTVDNFGTTGETPSHPELLDHLAARFVEDEWSTKKLVRRIVLSRTYRQAATGDARGAAIDPENRLFGRANRRRLDAECVRDAMLSVGGTLESFGGGRSFPETLSSDYDFTTDVPYRSVYLPVFRNALPQTFEAFDFADPSTVTGRRNDSTVPRQALFMMNNPFAIEQSRHAAEKLLTATSSHDERIVTAYRSSLGRAPTATERAAVSEFITAREEGSRDAWSLVFQALFASPEFRFLR